MELERAGVPTVVICSDEFGPLGRAEAQVLGMPGLPLVAVPHPLAGNGPQLVGAKGSAIVAEVVAALTGDPAQIAERHRHQFLRNSDRRLAAGQVCLDEVCAVDLPLTAE